MVGYHVSLYKVFWSFYSVFCSLLIYNYFGMLLVVITPNIHVAFTLRSGFYSMVNLFAGYVIPKPVSTSFFFEKDKNIKCMRVLLIDMQSIPKWWIWMYYLSPTSWILNGLLTSQYGDMEKEIVAFGERKKVSDFVEDYFGFRYGHMTLWLL